MSPRPSRTFFAAVLVFFCCLFLVQNWPVLLGRVPLAMDVLLGFPPWQSFQRPEFFTDPHAELGDQLTEFFPRRDYIGDTVRHGIFPLWNPYLFAGTPFQATPLNQLFYPLTIFYYLFPATVAWSINYVLRGVLAGVFGTWFGIEAGMSRAGAITTGLVFAFSGFMISWNGWPQIDSTLWMPLMFVAVERLRRTPSLGNTILLAFAGACTFLGGHPGLAIYVYIAVALYAAFRFLFGPAEGRRMRYATMLLAAGLIGGGLAAVQILPTAEWVRNTARSPDRTVAASLTPGKILSFVSRDTQSTPNSAGIHPPEHAMYCGMAALLLSALAFTRWHRSVAFFALLAFLSLQIVFGFGPGFWFASNAPVLKAFYNTRFILVLVFSVAVMSGWGVTFLQERGRDGAGSGSRALWWATWLGASALAASAVVMLFRRTDFSQMDRVPLWQEPLSSALLLAMAIVFTSPVVISRLRGATVGLVLVLLLTVDLVSYAYRYSPFFERHLVFPEPPVLQQLKSRDRSLYRVMSIDGTMPASAELPYRHSSALGYEYPLGRTLRLLHQFSEGETGPSVRAADLLQLENRLLDLLNVKYVVGNTYHASAQTLLRAPDRFKLLARDGTVELFENVQVLPRAFLVPMSGVRAARSPEEAFQRVVDRSFDPAVEAVVEGDLAPLAAAGAGPAGEARLVVTRGINRLSVIADVPAPSLLVISDGWYPGWRATVDGRSADVLVTNYAFKGVVLPAGRHEVALRFLPRSFILGLAVSVATIALLLVSVGAARRRRVTATPSSV